MKISPEHQQQLDEQGYVIIPDVLSETEISHYRALLLASLSKSAETARDGCIPVAEASMCGGW